MELTYVTILEGTAQGPTTTQELAAEIRREGRLYRGCSARKYKYAPNGVARCLIGVLRNASPGDIAGTYHLTYTSAVDLRNYGIAASNNDRFKGTPAQRCEHFAKILEAIP